MRSRRHPVLGDGDGSTRLHEITHVLHSETSSMESENALCFLSRWPDAPCRRACPSSAPAASTRRSSLAAPRRGPEANATSSWPRLHHVEPGLGRRKAKSAIVETWSEKAGIKLRQGHADSSDHGSTAAQGARFNSKRVPYV